MCGVFGIVSTGADVFGDVVNGLFQMQHRGQDACGIALSDQGQIRLHRGIGYVREVFRARPDEQFRGSLGCGHVRYPTQGANRLTNAQPHRVQDLAGVRMALASNGDLTNYKVIRAELEAADTAFVGSNDAELLLNFIAHHHLRKRLSIIDSLRLMQERIQGAYSFCLMTSDRLYAVRDPHAIRPLTFGRNEHSWIVASETTALDIALADRVGDIHPGEIIEFAAGADPIRHHHPDEVEARKGRETPAHCAFEYVYFSRPDSITFGQRVYDVRKRIGKWLADCEDVQADVVVPVPDSSNAVAVGYARASGLPFELGLIRNHYVGRTFIDPDQPRRDESVRHKFNPLRSVFKKQRVILIDDSIVRGTTLRKLVRMVRGAGADEVHVRIGSPITRHSCYYGVDTPDADKLIGYNLDSEGIRAHIEADSLRYMSVEGLKECVGDRGDFCMACFDGKYPIPIAGHKNDRDEDEQ